MTRTAGEERGELYLKYKGNMRGGGERENKK